MICKTVLKPNEKLQPSNQIPKTEFVYRIMTNVRFIFNKG